MGRLLPSELSPLPFSLQLYGGLLVGLTGTTCRLIEPVFPEEIPEIRHMIHSF